MVPRSPNVDWRAAKADRKSLSGGVVLDVVLLRRGRESDMYGRYRVGGSVTSQTYDYKPPQCSDNGPVDDIRFLFGRYGMCMTR